MGQYNKSHGSLKLYVDDKVGKRDVRPALTVLTSKYVDASHGVLREMEDLRRSKLFPTLD